MRPFSVLHQDIWRVIARAPALLLLAPVTVWFVVDFLMDLMGKEAYRVASALTAVKIYIYLTVFTALQRLAQRHRLNAEVITVSIQESPVKKAISYSWWRAYWMPLLASAIVAIGILFLAGPDADNPLLWIIAEAPVAVFFIERWLRYTFAGPAVIFEGVDATGALQRSAKYVKGNRARLFFYTAGLFLVYAPFVLGTMMLLHREGETFPALFFRTVGSIPLNLFWFVLWTVFDALLYVDCRNQKVPWFASEPIGPPTVKKLTAATRRARLVLAGTVAVSVAVFVAGMIVDSPPSGTKATTPTQSAAAPAEPPEPTDPSDCEKAPEACERECSAGLMAACTNLGAAHMNKRLPEASLDHAIRLFRKACDAGEASACFNLGILHEDGRGVPKDLARAAELYTFACDHGVMLACSNLATFHYERLIPNADSTKAVVLLRKACDGGATIGCRNAAFIYIEGKAVKRDTRQAIALLDQGCKAEDAETCFILSQLYESHAEGTPPNAAALVPELLKKACAGGEKEACATPKPAKPPKKR